MTKFLRLVIAAIISITLHQTAVSQSLSVNTDGSTAHPSALLDVKSTAKGVLVPRMSKANKNAIAAPATGLLIFQDTPDSIGFHYFDGTRWVMLDTASSNSGLGWLITGNAGTDSAINFLGTLDNKPLMLRQNNLGMGQLNTNRRNYFIGGGAGAPLDHVDGELVVPLSGDHFIAGRCNRSFQFFREKAELAVGASRCFLHHRQRAHEVREMG